jgi:membrane associated rhomboid family serine protease
MGDRDYPKIKRGSVWNDNNALMMLLILNGLAFVILYFIMSVYRLSRIPDEAFYHNIYAWFTLPATVGKFLTRPWTLFIAPFAQINFIMLLSSLFWLWTFGRIFQDLTGNRRIVPLYLYGSIAGGIIFLVANTVFPQLQGNGAIFNGASTGVVAIAIATTILSPQYRFFPMIAGGIPLWVITMIFILIDLSSVSGNTALVAAHVSSGFLAYGFASALNKGRDWSEWLNDLYERFTNLFNPAAKPRARRLVKQEVFYNTRGKQPFTKTTNLTQQKVDEILDKINQKGYDRLSEEEKDLLRRASEEDL